MKRIVIASAVLFLALPLACFAGSATSRWDLTIGGYVKFDMGYNTQAQGQDAFYAGRTGYGPYDNLTDRYGNFFSYAGETRLNFLVKGPDAWGAKTSAFVEGHFRGSEASPTGGGQGTFLLRHAFMQLDWPTSRLTIGQTWQTWGLLPTVANALLGWNTIGPSLKGTRQPQIKFEQNLTKNWKWAVAAISPTNTMGGNANNTATGVVDSFTLSGMPFFEGSIQWTTDKCGRLGAWQTLLALEGFYGRQKQVQQLNIYSGGALQSTRFTSSDVDAWGISLKGFVPIIPEKQGNKAGALGVGAVAFLTQNPSWYLGPATTTSYAVANGPTYPPIDPNYHSPTVYGGWGSISYHLTDKLFVNGIYAVMANNLSNFYMRNIANAMTIQNTSQYVANIMYDVNQAMRWGFEYTYTTTRYATNGGTAGGIPIAQKDGSFQMFRIGAYYFF